MRIPKTVNVLQVNIEFRSVDDSYKTTLLKQLDEHIELSKLEYTQIKDIIRGFWSDNIPVLKTNKLNFTCRTYDKNKLTVIVICYLTNLELRKAKIDSFCLEAR